MNEKISVIVPLYNKEKHIYQCLNSIKNQKFKNFEVFIIDDGSTDNSKEICINFCKEDDRFKYFFKNNGGVSSARNYGLKLIKNDYVIFIDADDYIEESYLESLTENKNDLIVQGFKKDEHGIINEYHIQNCVYNKQDVLNDLLINKEITNVFSVPYLKLFDMRYIKKYSIKFNEDLNFGEDFDFVLRYISAINGTVRFVDKCYYVNRIENGSLSRKDISNIWIQLSIVYLTIKKIYISNRKALNFFLMRFVKISLLNSYCSKYDNFKKIFYEIRNDNEFLNLKLIELKRFSIDWLICLLIKKKLVLISYIIFNLKRRKKI